MVNLHSHRTQRRVRKLVTYTVLCFFIVIVVFPLYWNLLTSLRMPKDVYNQQGMLIPPKKNVLR